MRRAIYNAERYDLFNKRTDARITNLGNQRNDLLTLVCYQQARLNSIFNSGEDIPEFVDWVLSEGSYFPDLDKQVWRDARDAIEGLTRHIDGLSNVLPVFGDTGDGQIE